MLAQKQRQNLLLDNSQEEHSLGDDSEFRERSDEDEDNRTKLSAKGAPSASAKKALGMNALRNRTKEPSPFEFFEGNTNSPGYFPPEVLGSAASLVEALTERNKVLAAELLRQQKLQKQLHIGGSQWDVYSVDADVVDSGYALAEPSAISANYSTASSKFRKNDGKSCLVPSSLLSLVLN